MIALLASCEIFVQPSIREGQGVTALEAMALGTVVVATRHEESAISDFLHDGENGMAIDEWSEPSSWASAISALFNDRDRMRKMSKAGRETARDFEWQASLTPQLDRYFRQVASGEKAT
jgi:glycosyltransferase involved in cell wall biosynthesis